jgi:hypothetical protein
MTDYGLEDIGAKVNGRNVVPVDDDGVVQDRDAKKMADMKQKIKKKNKARKEKYKDLTSNEGLKEKKAKDAKESGLIDESISDLPVMDSKNDWRTIGNESEKKGPCCAIS